MDSFHSEGSCPRAARSAGSWTSSATASPTACGWSSGLRHLDDRGRLHRGGACDPAGLSCVLRGRRKPRVRDDGHRADHLGDRGIRPRRGADRPGRQRVRRVPELLPLEADPEVRLRLRDRVVLRDPVDARLLVRRAVIEQKDKTSGEWGWSHIYPFGIDRSTHGFVPLELTPVPPDATRPPWAGRRRARRTAGTWTSSTSRARGASGSRSATWVRACSRRSRASLRPASPRATTAASATRHRSNTSSRRRDTFNAGWIDDRLAGRYSLS